MTDFVKNVLQPESFDPPVRSLMDMDFYEFPMLAFAQHYYPEVPVALELINRNPRIPVAEVVDEGELRAALDHMRTLRFTRTDRTYLRGLDVYGRNMFSEDFLEYLKSFQLSDYALSTTGSQYALRFEGPMPNANPWESSAMAAVFELYFRSLMRRMTRGQLEILYARAKVRLYENLAKLRAHPEIRFAEFGTRRRHSFLWQKFVLGMCRELVGNQFIGISNTWFAFHHDVMPIGTNAHKLPMELTALAKTSAERRHAQYLVLEQWQALFGEGLLICLPDTYGSAQFFAHAPDWLTNWRGFRQDSGDPIAFGEMVIAWYRAKSVDPLTKLVIFSDGLTVERMIEIEAYFRGRINVSFGWGTMLTNDFADIHPTPDALVPGLSPLTWRELFRPFSLVCKAVEAAGSPCVKLSDNIEKATGPKTEVATYLAEFGALGRIDQEVVV